MAGGDFDLVDRVRCFRSIGSESGGCGQRGAAGLDLATGSRSGGHGRVRAAGGGAKPAASGCCGAGRRSSPVGPQSRVFGHGWGRRGHPRDAHEQAKRAGASVAAGLRRSGG
jgi:hypothetical protein